ncbi:hypothetical protein DFH05DRAFT_1458428 [Lentinula detonsa]|uniref:Uncharacterized protein n=1 Tax=Lentinula detonsa TaxID=2804962 RepID=A0A9W8P3F1_9AGAR|nr:hypothetical protein DFH05DRAFT_1458428 [Lentinula detonsa]
MAGGKGGRPKKRARNISGLNNQSKQKSSDTAETRDHDDMDEDELGSDSELPEELEDWIACEKEEDSEDEVEEYEDDNLNDEFFDGEELQETLFEYAGAMDTNIRDEDWVPEWLKRKKKQRQEREKRGPDINGASKRTQRRRKRERANQRLLSAFGFEGNAPVSHGFVSTSVASSRTSSFISSINTTSISPIPVDSNESEVESEVESEAICQSSIPIQDKPTEPILQWNGDEPPDMNANAVSNAQRAEFAAESWEDEMDETVIAEEKGDIRGWEELREQIKAELSMAKKRFMPLSKVNQFLILRNFSTLRLKGFGRMEASQQIALQWHEKNGVHFARHIRQLARHYQVFEQLPTEKRGGMRTSRTLLSDENTRNAARAWLSSQKAGDVTPHKFQAALNDTILPDLGIQRKQPLCVRTARRWLVILGWRLTVIRKGVYMDGHERPDVAKYRQTEFLPKMAEFERRMAHYDGPDLVKTPPSLRPGEKEIIPQFHDESSLHALEYKAKVWLGPGQTILQKKTRGRIIHVSDFINPENGRLICQSANGRITRDARKVIYPGANGDDWWDTEQLLTQMKEAISVFEEAHPDSQALFVFDQSSAHASLGPDALRAWDMNKSDGGKQRKQHDTIIPRSNPHTQFRGQSQKMTLPDVCSTGDGSNTDIGKYRRKPFKKRRILHSNI